MPDDLLVTVKQALDDDHGWNWSSLVSGEWTWKPSCVRGWLRLLLDRCATAEAALTALRERHAEAVERAVDELFVNGQGEQSHRLVLTGMDGRDLGGWCKQAVINTIERALTARKDGSDE